MIERELANVFDLKLVRPLRTGPGMDTVGSPVTLAEDLTAIYEARQVLFKEPDGRELFLTGRFWIDPCDNDGNQIDVRAHDQLQYTDFRGVVQKRQVIRTVSPFFLGVELDHIQLDIGGSVT